MKPTTPPLRPTILELTLNANPGRTPADRPVADLIEHWLAALDTEDLADVPPASLASVLWPAFTAASAQANGGSLVRTLSYDDGHDGRRTALLVMNPDMAFLVDSILLVLRRAGLPTRAVLNAVLRGATDEAAPTSYVLVLLADELDAARAGRLADSIRAVAADAAVVHGDARGMAARMTAIAEAQQAMWPDDGAEVAAFLHWANRGGFELFGYRYYAAADAGSGLGVLRADRNTVDDTVDATSLAELLHGAGDGERLFVTTARTHATLHRDALLDIVGVRDLGPDGAVRGIHGFIGLFAQSAGLTPLTQIPFVRRRVQRVLALAQVRPDGFRAEKFIDVLESLPRADVFEASAEWLARVCSAVVALYKQPRTRVFVRRDAHGHRLSVLVYAPRERYGAPLVERLKAELQAVCGTSELRVQTRLADGPLARVLLGATLPAHAACRDHDIEQRLLASLDGWHAALDRLVESAEAPARVTLRRLAGALPPDYVALATPAAAYRDICDLAAPGSAGRIKVAVDANAQGAVTIRLLSGAQAAPLSQVLPALHNAGIHVDREQSFALTVDGAAHHISCLAVDAAIAPTLARPGVLDAARELIERLLNDEAEDGRLNSLVLEAGLWPRQVQLVRAYASYWRQGGCKFSLRYIADSLRRQPGFVRELVDAFEARFDPAGAAGARAGAVQRLADMKQRLGDVDHPDTEDILRTLADMVLATLRTSYFQPTSAGDTIVFKFDPSRLGFLPEPRPYREIYVFSSRFEGVHLRGGPVARGGLRWSDRMEDYRTEVLGLVKAQMVKNAVIVPAGAKGGFICKNLPKEGTRERIAAEGEAVYRRFIAGLLDVTDNRVKGETVAPAATVCYDESDPYLVVAADKGTATFSDIANAIALERGFWLGDAFASGGSNGYDHKKLGITAKGAWEAVKRHFHEFGHDSDRQPITVAGIGDMSGDVFGNGMLLSRRIRLVAAFDHRHIFIDPTPDADVSFRERQRLFALARSSWADYDTGLISHGGGVYPRSARAIALSPEARTALGIEAESPSPEQLMRAILRAPVDLFYNGGIGTYVKAAGETHAQVKDRVNDAIRVNGNELRCKVVAEGGNLGATQAGRIEFALLGGRIFTDAIDNSAGVDCSDHEVNIKVWLDSEVRMGKLAERDRNALLTDIEPDVERLVLRNNALQTHLLVRELEAQAQPDVVEAYIGLIADLEAEGAVSRELEQLPTDAELRRRAADGRGLTAPELAVVVANVKNRYKRILSLQPLTSQPWARALLSSYFPPALVATRDPLDHPLANAILATVLANDVVNWCGTLMPAGLAQAHMVKESEIFFAWAQGWAALHLQTVLDTVEGHALLVPPQTARAVAAQARAMLKAVVEAVLAAPASMPGEAGGYGGLAALFADRAVVHDLYRIPGDATGSLAAAVSIMDRIASTASFLFSAVAASGASTATLAGILAAGLAVRRQCGIDRIERALGACDASPAQHALRRHALDALRQMEYRLLDLILADLPATDASRADADVRAILAEADIGVPVLKDELSLEQAALAVWTLSDSLGKVRVR